MAREINLEEFMDKWQRNFDELCEREPFKKHSQGPAINSRQARSLAVTIVEVLNEMNKERAATIGTYPEILSESKEVEDNG